MKSAWFSAVPIVMPRMSSCRKDVAKRTILGLMACGLLLSSLPAGEPAGPTARFAASRTWTDSTGQFKIDGQLKFADEKGIELLKTDGRVVKLPLDKLSGPDRQFVQQFLAAEKASGGGEDPENPFAGGVPVQDSRPDPAAMTSRGTPSADPAGASLGSGEIRQAKAVVAGVRTLNASPKAPFWDVPPPIALPPIDLPQVSIPTPLKKEFFDSISVMAAGRAPLVVLNTYRQSRREGENHGNFLVLNAATEASSEIANFPDPWKLMAIAPNGAMFAAVRVEGFDKGNDLAIFKVEGGQIRPQFQFTAGGGSWDELHWVAFLPNNRLATISQKHTLTIWDLANTAGPKAIYRGSTGNATKAAITPAGELLAFPVGNNIAVISTGDAKMVGYLAREIQPQEIAFSPDGKTMAVFHAFTVTLYSMENGSELKSFAIAPSSTNKFHWVGSHLMVENVVYDVEREIPLWTYEGPRDAQYFHAGLMIAGFGGKDASPISVVKIPHDEAIREADTVDPKTIYAVVPGNQVRVVLDLGDVPADVRQQAEEAVAAKLAELGWVRADNASIVMEVAIKREPQDTAEYHIRRGFGPSFAPPGFGGPPSGPSEKVTFTPWKHSLVIKSGENPLFTSGYTRGAPQNLQIKEGESTQAAVNKHAQPDPNFSKNTRIPPSLLKAEYRDGIGKSKVTANGLE